MLFDFFVGLFSIFGDGDECFCRLALLIFLIGFVITGDRFCKWFPVVPRGADRFIASDDDGVARMVEVRFLNLQPHFCSHGYLKIHT
ncbi:hypothetical protein HanRHA438_Chr15g0723061 [Helianthus annuus]|nr:hypothetical protein HanRHA438_Chr15g0723061 [Helianthus annuus]